MLLCMPEAAAEVLNAEPVFSAIPTTVRLQELLPPE